MKSIELPDDLKVQVDDLIAQGIFHSFQSAVDELVRLGLASLKGRARNLPPGSIPQPERPNIPDPTRDILKM